jgi:hypothetical protein
LPVEIVTPYSESDLPLLNFTQSADVLYMCHPSYKPRQISRTAHDAWTIAEFANINGPFQTVNSTTSTTVYTSAATGTVTLTASSSIFSSANIGQLFYIEQKDFGQPWETNKSVSVGNIRRSDGKYYEAQNAATTGTLRPTHDSDNWSDGAVDWKFLHPGFGVCRSLRWPAARRPRPRWLGACRTHRWARVALPTNGRLRLGAATKAILPASHFTSSACALPTRQRSRSRCG